MFHFSGLINRISQNNRANKYSSYNLQTCTSSRIYDLFTDMNIITNLWNAIQFFAYILFCISLTAGKNGKAIWSVQLSPRPAGGPYNLKVSVQGTSITLADILFGDIWLCSGQSNMVFVVSHVSKIDWINYWTLKFLLHSSDGSRIFLWGGSAKSQSGCANLFFWPKTALKWKNLNRGGRPWRPLRSTTA